MLNPEANKPKSKSQKEKKKERQWDKEEVYSGRLQIVARKLFIFREKSYFPIELLNSLLYFIRKSYEHYKADNFLK